MPQLRTFPILVIAAVLIGCAVPSAPPTPSATPTLAPPTATDLPTLTPVPTQVLKVTETYTPTPDPQHVQLGSFPVPPEYILYLRDADAAVFNSPYYTELHAVSPDGSDDRLLMAVENLADPVRSPGGRYAAFSTNKPFVLDLTTGALSVLDPHEESAAASFFWLSDDVLYYTWANAGLWSTWRAQMPAGSAPELAFPPQEGSVVLQVLDDERLVISEPVADTQRQTVVLNWRTGERIVMAGDYQLVDLSPDLTHAILYGHDDGREGGYVIGFYIAQVDLKSGSYAYSVRVYPSGAATGFHYQPAFSPDGEHVAATQFQVLADGSEKTSLVVAGYDDQFFYANILSPSADQACWKWAWYSPTDVVASCRSIGTPGGSSELWLLPIDGSLGVRLAADGRPVLVP